jgi:hypothetical protein
MPTRKQRRRREKELRHEYEYVWEDSEGNELDPEDVPDAQAAGARSVRRPAVAGRQVQPPSWRRTLKRALVFAPIMLVTVMLLSDNLTLGAQVAQAAVIVAIFVPFSYFLDGVFWRSYQKRMARDESASRGRTG